MPIFLKSVYSEPQPEDGLRFLVDRLWPRGMSRERLKIDAWLNELAPSNELRLWFGHEPEKWEEFRRRYLSELTEREETVAELLVKIRAGRATLLFAARDQQHNNAVVLRDYLERALASIARQGKERS